MGDKGRDPDRFKVVHAQFVEQVAKAEAKVKEGLVELERRERERAARNEIDSKLQEAVAEINDCCKKMSIAVMKHESYERDLGALEDLRKTCNELQVKGHDVAMAALKSQADILCNKAGAETTRIVALVDGAAAENKARFN